jgi:hypothetical protein
MAGHAFDIREDRSIYTLTGDFDARAANALWRSVHLEFGPCERLVVDLRRLRSCHHEARKVLVEVHRIWAERARHLAYLSTDPRWSGLSLWIMRAAGDGSGRTLGSEIQLDEWVRTTARQNHGSRAGSDQGRAVAPKPTPSPSSSSDWSGINHGYGQGQGQGHGHWAMQIVLSQRPPWFDDMIRTHGFPGLKRWSDGIQRAMDGLVERHGELDAQVLMGTAAFWSGCLYCASGHLLAASLLYFESTRRLLPLSESDPRRWRADTKDNVLIEMEERLSRADLDTLAETVALQGRIKLGRVTADGDDPTTLAIDQAEVPWAMVNACPRAQEDTRVPALHPRLSRDRQLLEAYRQARREAAGAAKTTAAYGSRSVSG